MDIEFHYWITGMIAYQAGFSEEEAQIIAYSSQYVDDNDVYFTVGDRSTGEKYQNFISQTMDIRKPKNQLMRIYPIFHFVPGDPDHKPARRRDGKMHLLNTTPDNEYANGLLSAAFKSSDDTRIYRIGVATHAYVDTWAHQNFVGWGDSFNAVGINALPNIGHADVEHHPDWLCHRWDDIRLLEPEVNNNHRFLSAAERLFNHYSQFLVRKGRLTVETCPKWDEISKGLVGILSCTCSGAFNIGKERRLERYEEMAPWLKAYDETTWFNEVIETDVRGLRDSCDGIAETFFLFKDSHNWKEGVDHTRSNWFRFQEAVKGHERTAVGLLASRFKQMGIDISCS